MKEGIVKKMFVMKEIFCNGVRLSDYFKNQCLKIFGFVDQVIITLSVLIFARTNFRAFAQKSEKCAKISTVITHKGGMREIFFFF